MKTIKFPGQTEAYEIVDEAARADIADLADSMYSSFQLNANSYGEYLPPAGMAGRIFFKLAGSASGESGETTVTSVALSTPAFYNNGTSTEYPVVGIDWDNYRRVARYELLTPDTGVSHVNLSFKYVEFGPSSASKLPLRFYIGTDPDSHINGGSDSEYTGNLVLGGDGLSYSGEADVTLAASTQHYLWVFPALDTYSWWTWRTDLDHTSMTVTG